ncbi:MAG: hypothetical protein ACI9RP_000561, partial [Cyclobacteriaceae bacterium]
SGGSILGRDIDGVEDATGEVFDRPIVQTFLSTPNYSMLGTLINYFACTRVEVINLSLRCRHLQILLIRHRSTVTWGISWVQL